jgi:breast cancer 2 susceptibility protein
MQFVEKHREGPWNAEEATRINEQWKVDRFSLPLNRTRVDNTIILQKRREVEASKIREQLEKRLSRYEGYIDRLERKAGSQFRPGDEGILIIPFLHSFLSFEFLIFLIR